MVYTIPERVEIIELYFKNNECEARVAKFGETGSVQNKKTQAENPILNEPVELAVLGQIAMDGTVSIRQLAGATGASRTSIQRVLKKHKFHPYKTQLLQELNEGDFD